MNKAPGFSPATVINGITLRRAVDKALNGTALSDLAATAAALSDRYREERHDIKPRVISDREALAYLAVRLPATRRSAPALMPLRKLARISCQATRSTSAPARDRALGRRRKLARRLRGLACLGQSDFSDLRRTASGGS